MYPKHAFTFDISRTMPVTTMISGSYTRYRMLSWCLELEKQDILCKNILTNLLSSVFDISCTVSTICKRKNTKMYSAAREKETFTDLYGPRGELATVRELYLQTLI